MPPAAAINRTLRRRVLLRLVILLGAAAVDGQFIDGGVVNVACGKCMCEGITDDGAVIVFDNPSTGNRVSDIFYAYRAHVCKTGLLALLRPFCWPLGCVPTWGWSR